MAHCWRPALKLRYGLLVAVVLLAAFAAIGYWYRLELVVFALPRVQDWRDPIAANRPVEWQPGPEQAGTPPGDRPPNVIVILADDLGYNDISLTNGGAADGSLETPNIDSIAANGVVFTNGYAGNAVCSPSRAALMTGRYSTRFGLEFTPIFRVGVRLFEWMEQRTRPALRTRFDHDVASEMPAMPVLGMPASEVTLAETLKAVGYRTLHIGKWHLGGLAGSRPQDQGFDESLYMSGGLYLPADSPDVVNAKLPWSGIDQMVWASTRYSTSFNGGDTFEPDGYLTDYYTDEAVKAIDANRNRPFFLYLAHWAVHNPLQASGEDVEEFAHIEDHTLRVYAAMIRSLDRGVGRVLEALDRNRLTDNTLVIFTSDNGGAGYAGLKDINRPYRGWKLTLFEGGVHVPFLAQWPKRIERGTRYDEPVSHMDIFSTVTKAGGGSIPDDRAIDGVDLMPYLDGTKAGRPHETLFWRQGHHQVVRQRGLKLIVSELPARPDVGIDATRQRWLFDLNEDPTEQRDLSRERPDEVAMLEGLLADHNADQVTPMWPNVVDSPQFVDKTEREEYVEGDEYVYWPN
ncbi:MAG: sulfatase-like hydrolase/transferase [Gammaproteobacteria bacterium]|nr:sulfatase-like hydrolase/transferase [Gammaproteobacteria bacterium]